MIISLSSMDPERKILKILDVFRNFRHYPSGSNAVLCFERVKKPLNPFVFGTYEHRTTCFSSFWKSRLSGFLIFIHHFRSIFDQFSINFRSFLNVSWDLLGFIENPWNCIEKLYRDHPSRIHQTKTKLAFRVKTTQISTLNKLQTRTLCSGWFSKFLIFWKKMIFGQFGLNTLYKSGRTSDLNSPVVVCRWFESEFILICQE